MKKTRFIPFNHTVVNGLRNSFQSKGIFSFFAFYQEDKNRPSWFFFHKFDIKAQMHQYVRCGLTAPQLFLKRVVFAVNTDYTNV